MLNRCELTHGCENKKVIVMEMFDYLLKNMFFVRKNPTFEKTVRGKLIELQTMEQWEYAGEMYYKMFGEQIPL